jgi:hypothetical protein
MSKTMCKTYIIEDITKAKYTCQKCGAWAKKEKNLCKPKKKMTLIEL